MWPSAPKHLVKFDVMFKRFVIKYKHEFKLEKLASTTFQLCIVCFDVENCALKFFEDIHNSWLYCFTNPLEIGTRVPISRGLMKQYNQELCISS